MASTNWQGNLEPSIYSSSPSGGPPVEVQESAKPLLADDFPLTFRWRLDDLIVDALVSTLGVIVLHVFFDHVLEVPLLSTGLNGHVYADSIVSATLSSESVFTTSLAAAKRSHDRLTGAAGPTIT